MQKGTIPKHVIIPSSCKYFTTSEFQAMNCSGRGYAILRALGAHDELSDDAIDTVMKWTNNFHDANYKITPHTCNLEKTLKTGVTLHDWFRKRLGSDFQADTAAPNVSAYPGDKKRPSYRQIFNLVWEVPQWPELCVALSNDNRNGRAV